MAISSAGLNNPHKIRVILTYHTRPEVLMVGPHGSFYLGRVRRRLTHGLWVKAISRRWRSPNHAGLSCRNCAAAPIQVHKVMTAAWKPEDLTWTTKTTTGFGNLFRVRMFRCLESYCSYQKHFALQPTEDRALSPKRHDLSRKRRSS